MDPKKLWGRPTRPGSLLSTPLVMIDEHGEWGVQVATFRHINSYHCIINEKNFCRFLQVGECISPYLQYFIKSNAELFFQFSHIFQDFTTVTFCRNPKRKNGKTNVQKKTLMKRGKALNFRFFYKETQTSGRPI